MATMTPAAAARGRDRMIGMATFATTRTPELERAFDDLAGVLASGLVGLGGRYVLRVEFDPEVVSYEELLARFWSLDEPKPGARAHPQSAVLVHSSEQETLAHAELERRALLLGRPVTSAIARLGRCAGRF